MLHRRVDLAQPIAQSRGERRPIDVRLGQRVLYDAVEALVLAEQLARRGVARQVLLERGGLQRGQRTVEVLADRVFELVGGHLHRITLFKLRGAEARQPSSSSSSILQSKVRNPKSKIK